MRIVTQKKVLSIIFPAINSGATNTLYLYNSFISFRNIERKEAISYCLVKNECIFDD